MPYNLRPRPGDKNMAAIAPMDLVPKNEPATASIPLKCCICPKKPNFSDLSHLLTHVSSKSHLSNKFKAGLRKDQDSIREVEEYTEWEERYGINDLLSARQNAKEQKKTGGGGRRNRVATAAPAPVVQNSRQALETANRTRDMMKAEPKEYDQVSPTAGLPWSGARNFSIVRHSFYDGYQTPVSKRIPHNLSVPRTPEPHRTLNRGSLSDLEVVESIEASEGPHVSDDDSDLSKLKGVVYPGMGLFDSASEYQKRRRNQRKDESVLKNMIETSAVITPTEYVWDEDGDFQRIRDIYATPSVEGSPERKVEEREKEKKKRTRRAAVPTTRRTSTRTTRKTAAAARRELNRDDDAVNDPEEDGRNRFPSHAHGSVDALSVLHNPPKRSSNTQGLWADYASFHNPGVILATSGASHLQDPLEESGFEYRRRRPLRPLSANISLGPTAPDAVKPISFFPSRDNGGSSFSSQPLVTSNYYAHSQHSMGGGNFNPLCQTRPGQFNTYGFAGYGNETKPPVNGFQAINTMAPNLNNLSFNAYNQYGAQETDSERVSQDFDA